MHSVISENKSLKIEKSQLKTELDTTKSLVASQQKESYAAAIRAETQYKANQVIKDENDKFRACIADKSCGVVVRLKYIQAPTLPSENTGTPRSTIDEDTENKRDFESWVIDLTESIELDAQQIEGLKAELQRRSDPNYCKIQ